MSGHCKLYNSGGSPASRPSPQGGRFNGVNNPLVPPSEATSAGDTSQSGRSHKRIYAYRNGKVEDITGQPTYTRGGPNIIVKPWIQMAWNVLPPNGGWKYPDPSGTTVDGTDHDNLVTNVAAYRNANHLPLGDPESDVDGYLLGNWPQLSGGYIAKVEGEHEEKRVYGEVVKRKLSERVNSWAATRYQKIGAINFVDEEDAERRTGVCLNCPANDQRWRERTIASCPPCKERIQKLDSLLFQLRGGNSVVREKQLGACEISGQCNQSAVWLTEPALRHRKNYLDKLPEACWMKSLQATEKDS